MNNRLSPKVNILLSTYNGERFIIEQLDSLLNQTYTNIKIYIRDDGSTDSTVNLIRTYPDHKKLITLSIGNNIGVIPSFLQLLTDNEGTNELYAFCDQDDVWRPEKVSRAVEKIMTRSEPDKILYCSRLEYVDENLRHLGYSLLPPHAGFSNAVVENIATGCTVIFGKKIRELVLKGTPNDMLMHDWWAYLVASAFGDVIYDGFPSIQYRQHSNSVTAWESRFEKIQSRSRLLTSRLITRNNKGLDSVNQATRFVENYPDLPNNDKAIVNALIELRKSGKLWQRIRYVTHPQVARTNTMENMILKLLILFGWH